MVNRNTGKKMNGNETKRLSELEIKKLFSDEHLIMAAQSDKAVIDFFNEQIESIETVVLKEVKLRYPYEELLTVPGIGKILGITIMLETGDINRFPTERRKERATRRTGINIWRGHQRKESKTNQIVATKALSNKIARACYFIIKDQKTI